MERRSCSVRNGLGELSVRQGGFVSLVSVRVPDAVTLADGPFQQVVHEAYLDVLGQVATLATPHPVRFWNHIPYLHAPMAGGLDRYMVFNAGRFDAMNRWFGSVEAVHRGVATATGVGHGGSDLVIHCLACAAAGRSIENPRQVPAYRYSRRYGPVPPCFARATLARLSALGGQAILVGGTASVRGEQSVHGDNLAHQLAETYVNMEALVQCGAQPGMVANGLASFVHVRAYYQRGTDRPGVERSVRGTFPGAQGIEFVQADLCRQELLVEIEGVALAGAPSQFGAECT